MAKLTSVRKTPEEWGVDTLDSVVEIHDNKRIPLSEMERSQRRGVYPYCGANGIIDYIDDYIFDGEFVLLAEDGGAYGKFENTAYLMSGKFWVNNHAHILQALNGKTSNLFLLYALNFLDLRPYVVGSTRTKLNQNRLREIKLPLPPLPEQQKIASVLSTVDDAIQKVDDAIAKTERLKKGLMQRLLTRGIGHERFKDTPIGRMPEEWEIVELNDIGAFQYGYTTSAENEDTGIKFLRITDIKENGTINWEQVPYCSISHESYKKYKLKEGDILFARIGATAGKTCYIKHTVNGIFASYLIRFQTKTEIDPTFVFYFTQSKLYWSQAFRQREGQLKKGMNANTLSRLKIVVPNSITEQQKIAEILSTVDKKLDLEHQRKEKLNSVKKGLMNDLLTGKRRVKAEAVGGV